MMSPESKVKKEIVAYLDGLGAERCFHFAVHNVGYGKRGVPDRICSYRGRFFAIEVKADETKVATPWQIRTIREIIQSRGCAIVAWSVQQVKDAIDAIDADIAYYPADDHR